jgi:hypothetical protein
VAATRFRWPDVPPLGMVTFIDPGRVRKKRAGAGASSERASFPVAGPRGDS